MPTPAKKKALIFDMDDTLLVSKSLIYVYHPDSHECIDMINSREYVLKRDVIAQYYQEGYFVDTHEFGDNDAVSLEHLTIARPVARILRLLKKNHLDEEVDIFLVTGRANQPSSLQKLFLDRFQVRFPFSHIYPVGHRPTMDVIWEITERNQSSEILQMLREGTHCKNRKKIALFDILKRRYSEVVFYEDDPENIGCFQKLIDEMNRFEEFDGAIHGEVVHVRGES